MKIFFKQNAHESLGCVFKINDHSVDIQSLEIKAEVGQLPIIILTLQSLNTEICFEQVDEILVHDKEGLFKVIKKRKEELKE